MDRTIIPFPSMSPNEDPTIARAQFFAEVEYRELVATVPRAPKSTTPKNVY